MTTKLAKITFGLLLFILIGYGCLLRVYQLDQQSYWIDEGYTLNAVLATLEHGYPILDSGYHYSRGLLNTYLISLATKVGGFNPWATRSVAVVFGTAFIILIYYFTKKLFDKKTAVFTAIFVTFSYWEIAWSRQARMYIQLQFFFFLSLYLFWLLLEKFSYKRLIMLIISTLLAILSHALGIILLAIYIIYLLLYKLYLDLEKRKNNKKLKEILPIWWEEIKNVNIWKILSVLFLLIILLAYTLPPVYKIIANLILKKSDYVGGGYQNFLIQEMRWILMLTMVGALWGLIKKQSFLNSLFLVLSYFVPFLLITLSTDLGHYRYLFFILPILYIFAGYLIKNITELLIKRPIINTFLSLLLVAIIISNQGFVLLPKTYYPLEPKTPMPNFSGVYQIIKTTGWNNQLTIISPFPQMDKIYLGKSDYFLPISLTGKDSSLEQALQPNKRQEIYTDAWVINNEQELEQILRNYHGYIIFDTLAEDRLGRPIIDLIRSQIHTKLIWNDSQNKQQNIWLWQF
ncbi:MAG: glycosyltransferase family 39 protein [Patescibacteria group bacterium]